LPISAALPHFFPVGGKEEIKETVIFRESGGKKLKKTGISGTTLVRSR
jgi:hypothetical protein